MILSFMQEVQMNQFQNEIEQIEASREFIFFHELIQNIIKFRQKLNFDKKLINILEKQLEMNENLFSRDGEPYFKINLLYNNKLKIMNIK
jgi:hypothetical protein